MIRQTTVRAVASNVRQTSLLTVSVAAPLVVVFSVCTPTIEHCTNNCPKNFDERPHRTGRPKIACFPWAGGIRAPIEYTVPWAHSSTQSERYFDWFIRFSTGRGNVQRTDTHTHSDTHRPRNIGNNRTHLCTLCTRSGLIINNNKWLQYWQRKAASLLPPYDQR